MIIHADASCGENRIGVGYTIRDGKQVFEGSTTYEGSYTSMEAEYVALKTAARVAARFFSTNEHLFFYTDCQGLVEKISQSSKHTSETSEEWIERRKTFFELLAEEGFKSTKWSINWVPRERNQDADSLAHVARDSAS